MRDMFIELQDAQAALRDERTKVGQKEAQIEQLETVMQDLNSRVDQQHQTISLLVSEKTALTASVERLDDAENRE